MIVECNLIDGNGNVLDLISIIRSTLRKNKLHDELRAFDDDFEQLKKNNGKYEDVLRLFDKYVDDI